MIRVADAGLHLPLAPTVGLLGFTPPVAARVGRIMRSPGIHARPDGAGRLVCIDPVEEVPPFDPHPSASLPQGAELMRRLPAAVAGGGRRAGRGASDGHPPDPG